jgi:hypothetical protein
MLDAGCWIPDAGFWEMMVILFFADMRAFDRLEELVYLLTE